MGNVAPGRRSGSPTPDDVAGDHAPDDADPEVVDPLRIASAGIDEVGDAIGQSVAADRGADPGADPAGPDPLAVLRRALDEGRTSRHEVSGSPRRGLLGRLGRGRTPGSAASSSTAPSPRHDDPALTGRSAPTPPRREAGPPPEAPVEQQPPVAEPRVTTWAEDFEAATATGEWPAVGTVAGRAGAEQPTTDHRADAAEEPPAGPRRRGGRRRRRKDEPVTTTVVAEPDPADPGPEPSSAGVDVPVAPPAADEAPDRTTEPARDNAGDTGALADEQRLAAEHAEAERIEAERLAAQQVEDARLEQLRTPAGDTQARTGEPARVSPTPADTRWLEAEQAEAARIDAERAAAQRAEQERLEELRLDAVRRRVESAEQAERARLEAVRTAAEQAERDRLASVWLEEAALVAENHRQLAGSARPSAPETQPAEAVAPDGPAGAEAVPEPPPVATQMLAETPAAPPAPARPSTTGRPAGAEPVPRFVEFRSTSVLRYVFGAFFVLFAVAAVIAIFRAVSPGDSSLVVAAAGLTALAMLSWWALLSWTPPVVSISDGVLEVARGTKATRWDLRDPGTEITFRGRPSSRSWRAVVRDRSGKPSAISARQVDAAQFVELVEHYQHGHHPDEHHRAGGQPAPHE